MQGSDVQPLNAYRYQCAVQDTLHSDGKAPDGPVWQLPKEDETVEQADWGTLHLPRFTTDDAIELIYDMNFSERATVLELCLKCNVSLSEKDNNSRDGILPTPSSGPPGGIP